MARAILPAPRRPVPINWSDHGLHTAWLGHSTVLVRMEGFTLLTDPVFSVRVGINLGLVTVGLKRLVHCAASAHEILRPDLILLSHAHMDHFDLPSLRDLEHQRTEVITASSTSDLLRVGRYRSVHELSWGERRQVGPAVITAFRVNHWGARLRSDTFRGYNGYVIECGRFRVVFGGDTAYSDEFKAIRRAQGTQLAIMPIGAYDPWIRVHCNPEQALTMANHAGAEFILPVHHQTFQLSREPFAEPIERLLEAVGPHPHRVCVREIGAEFHLS
jgi:L-ascorbate metabolism protein UlaG (beta-lactamase superfamily)